MLSLPQQLLLLACHENKANILNTSLSLGLAGAVLAELLIQNKIRMNGTRLCRRDQVGVAPPAIRDAVLCDGFLLLPPGDQERPAKECVHHLHRHIKGLRARLTEQLVAKGLLEATNERALGLFPYKTFRLQNPHKVLALKDELRQVLFRPFAPSPRQLALIGLIKPAGLKVFTREERAAAKQRVAEVLKHDVISKAVAQSVADMAGATAAIIAASVVASV